MQLVITLSVIAVPARLGNFLVIVGIPSQCEPPPRMDAMACAMSAGKRTAGVVAIS
jgi:hypothetical protein